MTALIYLISRSLKMSKVEVASAPRRQTRIEPSAMEEFAKNFRGELLKPGDAGYDQARSIWNAMINRNPALIARCRGVADIRAAVNFAREKSLLVAVKGGGHNIAGNAVCDGGLMIDLSLMRSVRIEPDTRIAHVEPGATLGDFDHEAQAFGLTTPLGINSTTGVSGLTLGGGFGWLTRKYGMNVDNLVSVDVVTADGKFVHASEKNHPDLFWAIRGGSGNFGIVTRWEFKLYPLGPEVYVGLVVYSLDDAKPVMAKYRQFVSKADDNTSVWFVMRQAPPLPFLDQKYYGSDILVFACFHPGSQSDAQKAFEPVRQFAKPLGEHFGLQPYCTWQTLLDPMLTPGARNYWKSHNFAEISDGLAEVLVKYAKMIPHPETEIACACLGGAASRISPSATAYPHRNAVHVMNVHGRWREASDDEKSISWARNLFKETAQFSSGGVYVNFLTQEETGDRVKTAFGSNYERLLKTKKKYDPQNLFCMNQNISPDE